MSGNELNEQTSTEAGRKASLIWNIADNALRGLYKPVEYGKVILPMAVIKRFHDCLLPTHDEVIEASERYARIKAEDVRDGFLTRASGYPFYNTSKFTWKTLRADPDNVRANFVDYLNGFSENVRDILFKDGMNFEAEIERLADNNVLFQVIDDFGKESGDFSPERVSAVDMGYVFEQLVARFSETDDAGEHFTSRDIVYLMTDLIIAADPRIFEGDHIDRSVYDGSMGTSQMLSCMSERLHALDADATVATYGQELNPFTFAIAKASALIRGEDANNMRRGNTYDNDQFAGFHFDYVIQNPPFGISYKAQQKAIQAEHAEGAAGRFPCELPAVGDGQTLFALNGLAKLKDEGIMAIVQDASPLYKGNPGKGEDDYRRYVIENDWLDAIVQMPTDSFVNTGIATYVWLFDKDKPERHGGKVLLVDASNAFMKRRKGINNKKNDITDACRDLIVKAYGEYRTQTLTGKAEDGSAITVESKLFDGEDFGFRRVTVYTPERDEDGNVVRDRKGRPVRKTESNGKRETVVSDTEDIPLREDVDEYMAREVEPYNPGAFIDPKKTVVGYTIPFTRAFYKYRELEPADEIAKRILGHERSLEESLGKLFGGVRS